MFSFHPVKHVTTAEGGIIVTNSGEYAEKLRLFRSHGITSSHLSRDEGPWYYEMVELGYNYRMTDLQAALGVSQMNKLSGFIDRRRELAALYTEQLQGVAGVKIPYQSPHSASGWHLYSVQLDEQILGKSRKQIFEEMRAANIGVHVHYIPVYWFPYYKSLGYTQGLCPKAERWYEGALTLPLYPKMSDEDICDVVSTLKQIIG